MSQNQYFTKTHECFYLEGEIAVVSITEHAVEQLGEITFVQLPTLGQELTQGSSFGEIESVKTVSELYAPISGVVTEINSALDQNPELINEDLANQGWLIKVQMHSPAELESCLTAEAYLALIDEEA